MSKKPDKNEKEKKPAREAVNLTHVETQKQQVDKAKLANLLSLQQQRNAQTTQAKTLSPDQQTILRSFQKDRLLLDRIWIIVNQTRQSLALEPLKRVEVKDLCEQLVEEGYLYFEQVTDPMTKNVNEVYILTEKGKDEII